ncbi:MAG: glycosyltransferase [bacterium]
MHNGVVISVSTFARVLHEMGHQVTIFTAHHPEQQADENDVFRFPSIIFPSRMIYPLAIPIATGEARRMLLEQPFDLIHSNSPMLMGHVAVSYHERLNIPLVFTYHTIIEEYTHYIPLPREWVRRRAIDISREYSNKADHIITPSASVAKLLRSYHVEKPITVIPTGIDIGIIDTVEGDNVRSRFGIPESATLLAYAGRIAQEKNLPRLLKAFKIITDRIPDTHLLLMGGGPEEGTMLALAESLGVADKLHITGLIPWEDVIRGLRAADIFVFTSLTETQGLVIGEAMACNLPVVTVDADAQRSIITHGVNGVLVHDAEAPFADAVCALIADPTKRKQMGVAARKSAEKISARCCTEKLLDVYQQVIAGRKWDELVG